MTTHIKILGASYAVFEAIQTALMEKIPEAIVNADFRKKGIINIGFTDSKYIPESLLPFVIGQFKNSGNTKQANELIIKLLDIEDQIVKVKKLMES